MGFKANIGIIGAMTDEVREIISHLKNETVETVSGIEFHTGELFGKNVVIARCGVGKVFAASTRISLALASVSKYTLLMPEISPTGSPMGEVSISC